MTGTAPLTAPFPGATPPLVPAARAHDGWPAAPGPAALADVAEPAYKRTLAAIVLYLALGASGISWYPLIGKISFDNVAAVAVLILAPFAWRRGARPPLVFVLMVLVVLYLMGNLVTRSDTTLTYMVRPLIYACAGGVLSMIVYPRRPALIVAAGMLTYCLMFAYSASVANVDLVEGVVRAVGRLDRGWFQRYVIKATLNAFSSGDSEFAASQLNTISAFLVMGFGYMVARGRWVLATFAGLLIVILFSSAGILSLAILLAVVVAGTVRDTASLFRALVLAALLGAAATYFASDIGGYVEANLESDVHSREARLNQYRNAIEQINANPVFGSGELRGETTIVHNFVLFTWSNSGLVPMLMLLGLYGIVGVMLLGALVFYYTRSHEWIVVIALLLTFLLRSLVGGGGGMPVPSSSFALGLAVLEFRRLSAITPGAGMALLARRAGPPMRLA